MRYAFNCEEHGEVEVVCRMTEVQTEMPCPHCGKMCTRIYTLPALGGVNAHKPARVIKDPQNTNWKDKPKTGYC